MTLLTLTPISKRGNTLSTSTEPEELRELRDALRGALAVPDGDTPPAPEPDWRRQWPALAALDLPGLCVPEDAGGPGHRADAAAAAATVLGAALSGAPLAGIVTAASVLARTGAGSELLPDLLAGTRTCGFAPYDEAAAVAHAVAGADQLDALVLLDPSTGHCLLSTNPGTWTVTPTHLGDFDRTRTISSVTVATTEAVLIVPPPGDPVSLYRLLLAADALGGVQRSLDRAVTYCSQRVAFGKAVGGYQAVQHRLVDHTIRVRGMALAVAAAAASLTTDDPDAARAVLVAEAAVSAHAVRVLHDLVQLTGGIGFTWEHGLHLFERRAQADALLAANPRRTLTDLATREGWSR